MMAEQKQADETMPLLSITDTSTVAAAAGLTEPLLFKVNTDTIATTGETETQPSLADDASGSNVAEIPDEIASDEIASDEIAAKTSDETTPHADSKTKDTRRKSRGQSGGVKLTYRSAFQLEREISKYLAKHNLASKFLGYRQFWIFTVPQAVLTCMASILAFIATSDMLTATQKTILSTVVGSTSGVVVFLQTMGGICNYGSRSAMHQSTAIDLRDLRDDLVLIKHKLGQMEKDKGKKLTAAMVGHTLPESDSEEDDYDDDRNGTDFGTIQSRFRQSLSGCKSNLPLGLMEAFNGLDSNLVIARTRENSVLLYNVYGHIEFDDFIETKAYDILAGEILNARGFPMRLPNSKAMVQKTMERLRVQLNTYQSFWDQPV